MIEPDIIFNPDGSAVVTMLSPLDPSTTNTRTMQMTQEQFLAWRQGALIQDALGHLSKDDREFLMTGFTPELFDAMFKEDD